MAGFIDEAQLKLNNLVSQIISGKESDDSLQQNLHEFFVQASKSGDGEINDLERVKEVKGQVDWGAVEELIAPYVTRLSKGVELCTSLREKGNEFYKAQNLSKALRAYSLSILFSPNLSEQLATAYANRSAVLLQLNKKEEALSDIERSLALPCPDKLRKILEERMKKCTKENGNKQDNNLAGKLFQIQEPNEKIPNAQSFVQINFTQEKGRHLVTTEEVPAGTTLFIDQPFVKVLNNLLVWEVEHCHNCSKEVLNGIPCERCVFALFCSEKCRDLSCSNKGLHSLEHGYLPILHFLNVPHKDIQAIRLMAVVGPDFLLNLFHNRPKAFKNSGGLAGFDQNGLYSSSYLSIYHLISHQSTNEGLSSKLSALNAIFLKNLLKRYSPFFTQVKIKAKDREGFEDFISSLILRHLESIKYNAISLSKLTNDDKKAISFASAVYPLLSLCNHSCDPNCAPVKRSPFLKTCVVALKPLKKGEELCITYKPLYSQLKVKERQSFLAENYKFICNCQACEENWGPNSLSNSANMLILQPTTCEECPKGKRKQCMECNQKDVEREKEIRQMEEILFECHDSLEKKDFVGNLKRLPEVLNYFGRNGFNSYFPLFYVAIDLFKRALVHCVSDL